MSVDDVLTLAPDVRAAILWDVPALRGVGPSGQNLLKAFDPPPWRLNESADGPLDLAALGIVAAHEDRRDDALQIWEDLAHDQDASHRLLWRLLRLWLAAPLEDRTADLRDAYELAQSIASKQDRARIYRKLAIAASDAGLVDFAKDAAKTAITTAQPGTALHENLTHMLWQLGASPSLPSFEAQRSDDPLLIQPWIRALALEGARDADLDRFRDGLVGMWGGSFRTGRTPVDVLFAAQQQADWAGAVVLRDSLVRLVCAHLLDGAARSDEQIHWALSAWVLAGGDRIQAVISKAERVLDGDISRELIDVVAANNRLEPVLQDVVAGLWRYVADEDIERVLSLLDPGHPTDLIREPAQQVWAQLVWREPETWHQAFERLTDAQKQAATIHLIPAAVDELDSDTRSDLLITCEAVPQPERHRVAAIAAALAIAQGDSPEAWLGVARPEAIIQLSEWRAESVSAEVLRGALQEVRARIEEARKQAHEGRVAMGRADNQVLLGQLSAALSSAEHGIEELLVQVAGDEQMSAESQLGALQGLTVIRLAGLLSPEIRRELRLLADVPGAEMWGIVDKAVLHAGRLNVLADELTDEELRDVLSNCRSARQEVRLISVATVEEVLEHDRHNAGATWALVSALYDPSDEVLSRALQAIARGAVSSTDAIEVVVGAVTLAYRTGRNQVRRSAVSAALALASEHSAAAELVAHARHDSSWEVRKQAGEIS